VMALGEVETARVHVTLAKDSVFAESRQPAKASVMIKLRRGRSLARPSVEAIQHLAASAVEGLEPAAVSVIDMQGNLLSRPQGADPSDSERAELLAQYRRKLEADLLVKVNQTLEPLLGTDRFRAGVSVDLDLASGEQSEEVFDPAKSVMVTQQRSEEVSAPQSAGGVPGTPSTLPRPTGRPFGQGSNVSRRTENVTFQTSRTVRKSSTPQGVLRRLSLSVLLDQKVRWEGTGAKAKRVIDPPKPEEIKSIREIVSGAVGFTASRGDQLIVESLPFEATLRAGPPPGAAGATAIPAPLGLNFLPEALRSPLALAVIAGTLTLLLLAAAAGFFLLRRKKKQAKAELAAAAVEGTPETAALAAAAGADGAPSPAELTAGQTKTVEEMLADKENERERVETEELAKLQAATIATTKTDILTKHITEEARKNPEAIAQVLRNWLEED
jgi:flagellar M-ring protein FliF